MKKTTLLFLFIAFSFNYILAQCPTGPIVLSTQDDIDNFAINYPGCTQLTNNLTISGSTIENLNGLSSITSIDGDLVITANTRLRYLAGLDNLTNITGKFEISGTLIYNCNGLGSLTNIGGDFVARKLEKFLGLSSLVSIGGTLNIEYNGSLETLIGLDALTTIGGDLKFKNNNNLLRLLGVNNLQSIGGDFAMINVNINSNNLDGLQSLESIGGNLDITSSINSMYGLSGLTSIGGNLDLNSGSYINDLDGLLSLNSIGGDFIITNSTIEDMTCATLQTIGGSLLIQNCDELTNINFPGIAGVGGYMSIFDNGVLTSIAGYTPLSAVGSYLKISNNGLMTTIPDFNNLTTVGGDLNLSNNFSLLAVNNFQSLTNVPGSLDLSNSAELLSISGFNAVETIGGGLKLDSNPKLETLAGFNSLLSVGADFKINNNNSLINFSGFNSVTEITGAFSINQNPNLQAINVFNALETVGSYSIIGNHNLDTLTGFNAITTINGNFEIIDNIVLSNLNSFPLVTTVSGSFIFSSNSIATQFQGFENLEAIGGDMKFTTSPLLVSMPSFNSLASISGDVWFDRVDSFKNLNTLSSLTAIGGSMRFENMETFSDVEGLNNLLTIGGGIYIARCKIQTGFDSLVSMGGTFYYTDITIVPQFQGFDSLETLGGSFVLSGISSDFQYFYWPPNLTTIGGGISVVGCGAWEIIGMEILTSIGSNITFYQNGIRKIDLNLLVNVPGHVEINRNGALKHVNFSSLETVDEHFEIEKLSTYLNLNNLTTVGDYFKLEEMGNSSNPVVDLVMSSITSIGSDVTIDGTVDSLLGWENLTTINGNLSLKSKDFMPGLYGLEGLTTVTGNCEIRGDFSTFSGLDNLTSIGGYFRSTPVQFAGSQGNPVEDFTGLGQLGSIGSDFLIEGRIHTLNGISSLETVGGNLKVSIDFNLQNLIGLENLQSVEGDLLIKSNTNLTSLEGLDNLDYNLLDNLEITSNPNLSMCSILPVCGYLQTNTNYIIYGNGTGCDSDNDILSLCNYNTILGNVRYDFNVNGCDSSDYGAGSILIDVSNGVNNYRTLTKDDGSYLIFVGEGTFTISINSESLPENFEATPASATTTFTGNGNEDTVDFCLTATTIFDDLRVTILPLNQAQPGFETEYLIVYENLGTQPLNGDVTLQFDDSRQSFLMANPSQTTINNDIISWDFTDLLPFQSKEIRVVFNTFPPPINQGGDILHFSTTINPIGSDANPDNNVAEMDQIIVNSYDPNDKQVAQGTSIFIDEANDYLDYVIRFQNTGTANATTVKVTDHLSNNLNWNTIRTLSSSHEYRVEIRNNNEVNFIFENIDLPPETTDPEGSNGYIAFQILPISNLQIGDSVDNTANIFFDYNPAIITNTVTTTIIEELGVTENSLIKLTLFPVPTSGNVTIKYSGIIQQVELYSELGQLLSKEINLQGIHSLNTEKLANGIYFVKIKDSNENEIVKKLIRN
ncbi:conserved repeat protein [Aequorivita sublithincola DSM 14238]|uniref:Conserved repeat protein n=1 Tax=Aequorivita sublithincola (strain DSM 14238 / LMG 21431 / ACAM 643 / 9-3) TaxID=746697 RepID=I3YXE2_AEQSU|nr:T9SS type A sorting domain-containing protein [Aequorivita sublithincola]AFL81660.1 conserved repeat protein [Aequorivita sublithincola DSM 14238]